MIVCIGDIMLDVLLLPELRAAEQKAGIAARPGGSAANTAAWIARLGGEAAFIGCVGEDAIGRMLIAELASYGVITLVRSISGVETGAVAVELTPQGERIMRSSRGANNELEIDDIRSARDLHFGFVHLTGYSLLGHADLDLLHAAGDLAREHSARISFDPSSPSVIGLLGENRLLKELGAVNVDILLPNREEGEAFTGCQGGAEMSGALLQHVRRVAIKDGARGALVAEGTVRERIQAAANRRIDVTGAGDAFNAGLLLGLEQGKSLREAARLGVAAAGEVIEGYGGRPR